MYKRFLLYQDLWICFVHRFFFFFLVDERFYLFIHFINSAFSVYFFLCWIIYQSRRYICKFLIYFKCQIDYISCNLEVSYFLKDISKYFYSINNYNKFLNYVLNYTNKKENIFSQRNKKKQVHMFHFNKYNRKFFWWILKYNVESNFFFIDSWYFSNFQRYLVKKICTQSQTNDK